MSILNITNLTDTPEKSIRANFDDAFEQLAKVDDKYKVTDMEKWDYVTEEINRLEEYMNESRGSELLGIIDNYIVNKDYYSDVKDYLDNRE